MDFSILRWNVENHWKSKEINERVPDIRSIVGKWEGGVAALIYHFNAEEKKEEKQKQKSQNRRPTLQIGDAWIKQINNKQNKDLDATPTAPVRLTTPSPRH